MACRYVHGISKVNVPLPSCASINSGAINAYWDMVGDTTYSHSINFRCGLPSAYICPLPFPQIFSLIRFISCKAYLLYWTVRVSRYTKTMVLMSCIWIYSFSIYPIVHCQNISIPLFSCIWLYLVISDVCANITPNAILWKPIGHVFPFLN